MAYDELRRLALICQAHMMFPSASEVLGYSFFVKIVEHLFDIFQTTFSWLHLSLGLHLSEWRGKSCLSIWEIHDKLMRGKHNNTTSTQPACASLLLIQVPQHLVQQKGDQLAYLKKEKSLLWGRRNKSYFYYWKWWERKKVPTSLSDGAGPYISDGYLLVRIPKILIQILLIEK